MNGFKVTLLFSALLFVAGSVAAAVKVELEDKDRFPGDLLEMRVSVSEREYVRRDLNPPRHPHLRLLSEQSVPVFVNEESEYEQGWILVYQAVEPGDASLGGGVLFYAGNEDAEGIAIEEKRVRVASFEAMLDHDEVEPLIPEMDRKVRSGLKVWIAGTLLLGAFVAVVWGAVRSKRGAFTNEGRDSKTPSLHAEIERILSRKTISRLDAQCLVREYKMDLSPSSLASLEKVAYSKKGETQAVLAQLEKELAR
ncbi:hypothetical protein [Pelagicoccus mobilis]|uniref:Uncharacterized protein n=1 Tax=Pelagicoccus mobilis TaxID=415221 RepID=A0A934RXW1_9BACT|nr:hypothetical protein [Pelagicoccus mobilis]MBK1877485.1 hypothetical protein [Pelagicoccus mobilis]